jgi:nitrate/nitrite transporter NarK
MLQSMDPGALASLAAIIGLVGRAAWPLLSTRVGVLRGQLLIGVAFAAHYALIGIATAAIVNVLGSCRPQPRFFRCTPGPRGTRAAVSLWRWPLPPSRLGQAPPAC